MFRYNVTIYEIRHIERLTLTLHNILTNDYATPVSIERCCATVAAGLALNKRRRGAAEDYWEGRPWSSSAAFAHLGGLGYVSVASIALEALNELERRCIIYRVRAADYVAFSKSEDSAAATS